MTYCNIDDFGECVWQDFWASLLCHTTERQQRVWNRPRPVCKWCDFISEQIENQVFSISLFLFLLTACFWVSWDFWVETYVTFRFGSKSEINSVMNFLFTASYIARIQPKQELFLIEPKTWQILTFIACSSIETFYISKCRELASLSVCALSKTFCRIYLKVIMPITYHSLINTEYSDCQTLSLLLS